MATDLGTIRYKIEADVEQLDQATDSTDRYRGETDQAKKSNDSLNQSFRGVATAIKIAAVALGGLSFGRIIREAADFEQAMLGVRAVSGATAEQFSQLSDQARTLGATTQFSAQQAAEAQRFLAQAGFAVNDVLSATPGVLKLATAANLDLASAADIASNVLSGFRLPVQQLSRVTDVLAKTAASANTDVGQLGQALSFAAPIATAAGISIEETAAAIGALSDAGLQGSRAGTGLVGVIRQLSRVTPQAREALARYGLTTADVDLSTRSLQDVIETLGNANISVADSFTIFGSEAGSAAQILTGTADRVDDLTKANRDATGAAQDMADIMGSGLRASIRSLNSAVSEAVLQMGDSDSGLGGAMGFVIQQATGIISVYNGMLPEFARANDLTEQQTRNLNATAIALQSVAAGAATIGGLTLALRGATVAQVAFNVAARANPYALLAAGAVALVVALAKVRQANDDIVDVFTQAADSAESYEAAQQRLGDFERARAEALREVQRQEHRLMELQSEKTAQYMREEDRVRAIASAENDLDAARQRFTALNEARRNADLAQFRRQADEKDAILQSELEAEQAAADERARIAAELRAQEELEAQMRRERIAAEQAAQRRGIDGLRASLDERFAINLKYNNDVDKINEAFTTGAIESEDEMYDLLIAVGERRTRDLANLERDIVAEREAARLEAERAAMARRLNEVAASAVDTRDPEIARIQAQIDFLEQGRAEGLEIEGSYADALVTLERDKQSRIDQIQEEYAARERARQLQNFNAAAGLASATVGIFNQLSQNRIAAEQKALNATENATAAEIAARNKAAKAAFEDGKNLQLGLVGINTAAAIMNELATNPNPFAKWVNVAAIAATGGAQALAISASQFGGLSGGGGVSQPSQGQQPPGETNNFNNQVTVNVSGADGDVVQQIEEFFSRDGVIINPDSTQGRLLRG